MMEPPKPDEPSKEVLQSLGDPALDPFEIEFLPEYDNRTGPRSAFMNEYGVVIGDHEYDSPQSPLNQWSVDTDPSIMSGAAWVHPRKDIGFRTQQNRQWFEQGIPPRSGVFMHPVVDVAYKNKENSEQE